jgi:FHA domain/Lactonase, 7-bladed beta-propeller
VARESLQVITGAASGTDIPLEGEFVVGRGEQGSGNLADDTEISRRHARFRQENGHFVVEDLGSTNGTYVNGRRVTGPTVLAPGDEIKLGKTLVKFNGVSEETHARPAVTSPGRAAVAEAPVAQPPAAAAAPAPAAPAPATASVAPPPPKPGGDKLPPAGGPISGKPAAVGGDGPKLTGLFRDALVLLAVAVVLVAVWAIDDNGDTGARADVTDNCGANIGKSGAVGFVAYSLSNIANSDNNSVLAVAYDPTGKKAVDISQCMSGGTGATQLTMPGTVDGNDQIVVNPQHTLLFAVNQGSDSIAVFNIQKNGGLKPVDGSPFPSGGKAPGSLGISGDTLLVVNRSRDGSRDLETNKPNYTSFKIAADGKLTQVPGSNVEADPATAPTAIQAAPQGGVAFGPSDGGPIRSFTVDASGKLALGAGSPITAPPSAYPPSYDPKAEFALGTGVHPTKPYVYFPLPTVPSLAAYRYDKTGKLTFVSSTPTVGAFLPCWIAITKDGHFLYTTSAATNNVTVFDISNPGKPVQIQSIGFMDPGNAWNLSLTPDDKFLVVNSPRAAPVVPKGKGNYQHVLSVGPDGKLTDLQPGMGNATKLPVPIDAAPYGIAVLKPGT